MYQQLPISELRYFTKASRLCNQRISGIVTNSKSKLPILGASVKAYDQFGGLVTETTTTTKASTSHRAVFKEIQKGIDASIIDSAVGYGESRLTNKCKKGVKCAEADTSRTEDPTLSSSRSNFCWGLFHGGRPVMGRFFCFGFPDFQIFRSPDF